MEQTTAKKGAVSIGDAFGYVFDEDSWVSKVVIGGLMLIASIFILPIPFLGGYQLRLFKNVLSGKKPYLPEWQFDKETYVMGLKVLVVGIGYAIPSILLSVSNHFLVSVLQFAYNILMMGIMPFAMGRLAETGKVEAAFDIKWVWNKITNNVGGVAVVVVGGFLAGLAALVGLLGLLIGVIFTAFWANLVSTYLQASLYKNAK